MGKGAKMRAFVDNSMTLSEGLYKTRPIETLKDIVEYTTSEYPKRIAYMYKTSHKEPFKELTYGEFRDKMNALGTELIHMGFKNSKIAVLGDNSYRYALTYLTTVCGVGTIVPIDKNLEIDEIENLVSRADVEIIFTDIKLIEKLKPLLERNAKLKNLVVMNDSYYESQDERILSQDEIIDRGMARLVDKDYTYIDAVVQPDDLSTILFTSGTTGLAKGVMLSHRNLATNVMNTSKMFNIPRKGRVLDVLPMHHAYEMSCTVLTGFYQAATVVICEGLKHLQGNFVEAECSVMLGVPLVFENIHKKIFRQAEKQGKAESLQKGLELSKKLGLSKIKAVNKRLFKSIQGVFGKNLYCLIAGGAAINPEVIEDFRAMGIPIIQGYGMTENAPLITVNPVKQCKPASVGPAIPGTEVRIINSDDEGNGEIIVRGPSVMLGYYNDPENTAETIIDGWLHTGDYGYMDEDGYLYITGRKKNVIITKTGKNIFPEEIEYYLLLEDDIAETIVYGKENMIEGDLLCTAIIQPDFKNLAAKGITEDEDIYRRIREIVDEVNAKVPLYKKIRRIEVRENDFIKTTTLKIKRQVPENYEYKFDDRTFDENRRF